MKKLLVTFILDDSGSMMYVKDRTISGFNDYLDSLKPKGKAVHVTLVKFSSRGVEYVIDDVPVKDAPHLTISTYMPNGNTPLYDAIGKTIKNIDNKYKNKIDRPDFLIVTMTDGQENDSREYAMKQIHDLITEKEKEAWTFAYLGANQDAWAVGDSLGTVFGNIRQFDSTQEGITRTYAATTVATSRYLDSRNKYYSSLGSATSSASVNFSVTDYFSGIDESQVDKVETLLNKKMEGKRKMTNPNRSLYKVYVVDPRGSGKLLTEKWVIAEDENKATLKSGVYQTAADAGLELEQVDVYVECIAAFIRPRKETQKVKIAKEDEE